MSTHHYDVIIIGTGAGGSTLAHRLAPSGKKILILERGGFLPREKENWDFSQVLQRRRYRTTERWLDKQGKTLHPDTGYYVGGNTKVYGGVLFRLREQDFETVYHYGGVSPQWPLSYQDLEPYYTQAEKLYQVHGQHGLDPTEPKRSEPYPLPPVQHERRVQEIHEQLKYQGLHPFYLPLAIQLDPGDRTLSTCIRCNTCDGFPCLLQAKSDAEVTCIRPSLAYDNVTLRTNTEVVRLQTSPSGQEVTGIEVKQGDQHQHFSGDIVVVSCGAINSAALLLRSANEQHPYGLANRSNQVGRNLMKHQHGVILNLTHRLNLTVFQKTLAINDFYWGEPEFNYPMGHVQLLGKVNKEAIALEASKLIPGFVLAGVASHSSDWLVTSEDLPDPKNRVRLKNNQIVLDYTTNNTKAFDRLMKRWLVILKQINAQDAIVPYSLSFYKRMSLERVAHQVGTCRFGRDPNTSVLDPNCRTHDIQNLYVVDGSFFPSSAAVNPSLTIMAIALRVGDHLLERLQSSSGHA